MPVFICFLKKNVVMPPPFWCATSHFNHWSLMCSTWYFTGTVCSVSTQVDLPVRESGPYVIIIQAYNPDKPYLTGNSKATINVYVTQHLCFVIIDPTNYYTKVVVADIKAGEEVVKVNATSLCGVDGLVYNITAQTLTPSKCLISMYIKGLYESSTWYIENH